VTCYADHLLKDYELKVVPLHLRTRDVVVATSRRIKRELLELAPTSPPDKILVKPNAIDCTRFPVLPRPEPAAGHPHRLVVTSRIEPKKGLVYLADAVKLLRDGGLDVECHVVGDSDRGVPASENYRAELWERVERHGLAGKFHLEGRQDEEGVRRFLAQAHLFVAPFVETEAAALTASRPRWSRRSRPATPPSSPTPDRSSRWSTTASTRASSRSATRRRSPPRSARSSSTRRRASA
jgi:glycosyltransferase involved in cell wall biosynthesis